MKRAEASAWTRWWNTLTGREADSGAQGERAAERFLRSERNFAVIARNWRSPKDRRDELDLVCRDGDVLVFVEVKARAATALVPGYYAVDKRKKEALRRACRAYLGALKEKPHTWRFDVVEVELPAERGPTPIVRHFENIPLLGRDFRL
ncbi:YraN family protein [Horticoccus luteus]|uniref:YraN family protein n=1 Tax=Horticoccus luteus TaxID=2862869 RepID=A0A8F9TTG8_9BACT|nr:YraN family protein [Horticoccus luteus]QYM77478.1 YraN family protein [Horticoccus luteus]